MALILLKCCRNRLSNNTGKKQHCCYKHPWNHLLFSSCRRNPPPLGTSSQSQRTCRAVELCRIKQAGASGFRCPKNSLALKSSHTAGRSVRPPPKLRVTRHLMPLRKSRLFLWLLLPFSQTHVPLVLMRSYCLIEHNYSHTALHCSIC